MTTEMATPESSDSSAATRTTAPKPEDVAEAVNQLVQGKRHMLVQDYVSAVSSLEKACKLFAESYGETANECGEPYLYYGKALLELSRMETGVLGHALQGVESEEDEDEEEAESEDKDSKDSDDQVENPDNVTDENDEDEDGDESESIDEKSQDEATADDAEAGPSNSTETEKEKDDEVTNLQLAWEVLELAKVIFDRQGEKDEKMKLKSAEVLHKLGEVSIESENYTQAIEDLNSCLDIQKKILTTDDRTIAETYYQLGLAFSLDNQFDNSVEHFTNAIRVLEERIANCRQVIERGKPETKEESGEGDIMMEDPLETAKKELEELEALIPDIKTKIEDTEDMKKTTTEAMKEEALARLQKENSSGDSGAISNSPQASPSKPTKDVSHLVKRKRKPEDELVNDSKEDIKKVKSDNDGDQITTNGNAVNGDQKMEVTVEVEAS